VTLRHWVVRGTGTPKDIDEVNKREVCECDGWSCDLELMGASSILSIIRNTVTLARTRSTLLLRCTEKTERWKRKSPRSCWGNWTPEAAKKRSVSRWSSNEVYYESKKWELKTRPTYECRCDERLKTKSEKSTRLVYTGLIGELEAHTLGLSLSLLLGCTTNAVVYY
jgi:hypothetical protein